jgi:hypothetical protein
VKERPKDREQPGPSSDAATPPRASAPMETEADHEDPTGEAEDSKPPQTRIREMLDKDLEKPYLRAWLAGDWDRAEVLHAIALDPGFCRRVGAEARKVTRRKKRTLRREGEWLGRQLEDLIARPSIQRRLQPPLYTREGAQNVRWVADFMAADLAVRLGLMPHLRRIAPKIPHPGSATWKEDVDTAKALIADAIAKVFLESNKRPTIVFLGIEILKSLEAQGSDPSNAFKSFR